MLVQCHYLLGKRVFGEGEDGDLLGPSVLESVDVLLQYFDLLSEVGDGLLRLDPGLMSGDDPVADGEAIRLGAGRELGQDLAQKRDGGHEDGQGFLGSGSGPDDGTDCLTPDDADSRHHSRD